MAARCLPVVLDPETISQEISEIFSKFRLDAQNELHGRLMGIRRLEEFYSYRTLSPIVYGMLFDELSKLDAILSGMEDTFDMIMTKNANPLTKAAYTEIVHSLSDSIVLPTRFVDRVLQICLEDIRSGNPSPVGMRMYLEQASTVVLAAISSGKHSFEEPPAHILELFLRNANEEVVLNTISWISKNPQWVYPKQVSLKNVRMALCELVRQDKWDGVCALALEAMSHGVGDDIDNISLLECIHGFQQKGVRPVKEGWIILSGYAARIVSAYLTMLISGICERHN